MKERIDMKQFPQCHTQKNRRKIARRTQGKKGLPTPKKE
jgi:hypothetical protein